MLERNGGSAERAGDGDNHGGSVAHGGGGPQWRWGLAPARRGAPRDAVGSERR